MTRPGRLVFLISALALLAPGTSVQADEDDEPIAGPSLRIPGLPPIPLPAAPRDQSGAPGVRAPEAARPNADIYHEYGTVTPGGGNRDARDLGNRGPGDRGFDSRSYGGGSGMFGGMVVGPGGVVKPYGEADKRAVPEKKKPPTLEEKQAQIRKALMPKPPLAEARRRTLDDLYGKLAEAKDADESKGLASLIAAIWMRSGSDTADLLMSRAEKAIGDKKYTLAIRVLDKVVELRPNWAEAWNKRAAARYLDGDLNGSMADVDHVLKLEPKHFAALNGMAMILQRTGMEKRALQIYRRELAIYPHQPELEKTVEKLTLAVEGQGI